MTPSEIQKVIEKNMQKDREQLYQDCLDELKTWLSKNQDWGTLDELAYQFFQAGVWEDKNESFDEFPSVSSLFVILMRETAEQVTEDLDSISANTATFHGPVLEVESWRKIEDKISVNLSILLEGNKK